MAFGHTRVVLLLWSPSKSERLWSYLRSSEQLCRRRHVSIVSFLISSGFSESRCQRLVHVLWNVIVEASYTMIGLNDLCCCYWYRSMNRLPFKWSGLMRRKTESRRIHSIKEVHMCCARFLPFYSWLSTVSSSYLWIFIWARDSESEEAPPIAQILNSWFLAQIPTQAN